MLWLYLRKFIKTAFISDKPLKLKDFRKKYLPWAIGWVCIFIWLYSYFLPMGGFKFESELYNNNVGDSAVYYYIMLFTGCMIPVLFDGRKFVPKTFCSVIISFICFIVLRFTGAGILSRIIMTAAAASIGHIFASNVYAFFMVLNNSEKFYSMILAVLLPKILLFAKPFINETYFIPDLPSIIIFIIIFILAVCSYFFKYNTDELQLPSKIKVPLKAYGLMPLVFVVLALNDVIAPSILMQIRNIPKNKIEGYYFIGILIGITVVLVLQRMFAINICNMLNLSFSLLLIGFIMEIVSKQNSADGLIAAVCFGISYAVGFINIYYLAGFMTKKFQSITFYRIGIILSALYYFSAFIVMEIVNRSNILRPAAIELISIYIVIIFFMLTPFFIKILYSGEWIEDTYRTDVTRCSRLEAKFQEYKLTRAETEVCRLLLEGYTLRQISGLQSKSYATINTYYTSIYRKLNINSRAELLLFFQDYIKSK